MGTFFLICAIVGGVIILCQSALSALGLGGGHDFDSDHHIEFDGHHGDGAHTDHGSTWFFNVLSIRALVSALTFFGLAGMATLSSAAFSAFALPVALFAAAVAMVVVAWLMSLMHTLQADGTVRIESTVGATGSVYLTVPPKKEGSGKVTVKVQNRTMEYKAVTAEDKPLPTGSAVMVVGIEGADIIEVGPIPD